MGSVIWMRAIQWPFIALIFGDKASLLRLKIKRLVYVRSRRSFPTRCCTEDSEMNVGDFARRCATYGRTAAKRPPRDHGGIALKEGDRVIGMSQYGPNTCRSL
jgi:hypothetical protein